MRHHGQAICRIKRMNAVKSRCLLLISILPSNVTDERLEASWRPAERSRTGGLFGFGVASGPRRTCIIFASSIGPSSDADGEE